MSKFCQIVKAFQETFKRNCLLSRSYQPPRYLTSSQGGGNSEYKKLHWRKECINHIQRAVCCPGRRLDTSFLTEIPPTLLFTRQLSGKFLVPNESTLKTELNKTNSDNKGLIIIPTWMKKTKIKRFQGSKSRKNHDVSRDGIKNEPKSEHMAVEPKFKLISFFSNHSNNSRVGDNAPKHNFYTAILNKISFSPIGTKNAMSKRRFIKSKSFTSHTPIEESEKFKIFRGKYEPINKRMVRNVLQKREVTTDKMENNETFDTINNVVQTYDKTNPTTESNVEKSKSFELESRDKKPDDRSQIRRYKKHNVTNEEKSTIKLKAKKFEKVNKPEVDFYIKKLAAKYGKISSKNEAKPKRSYDNNKQRITYGLENKKEQINYITKKESSKYESPVNKFDRKISMQQKKRFNQFLKAEIEKIKTNRGSDNHGNYRTVLSEEKIKRGTILRKENLIVNGKPHGEIQTVNKRVNSTIKMSVNNGLLKHKGTTNLKFSETRNNIGEIRGSEPIKKQCEDSGTLTIQLKDEDKMTIYNNNTIKSTLPLSEKQKIEADPSRTIPGRLLQRNKRARHVNSPNMAELARLMESSPLQENKERKDGLKENKEIRSPYLEANEGIKKDQNFIMDEGSEKKDILSNNLNNLNSKNKIFDYNEAKEVSKHKDISNTSDVSCKSLLSNLGDKKNFDQDKLSESHQVNTSETQMIECIHPKNSGNDEATEKIIDKNDVPAISPESSITLPNSEKKALNFVSMGNFVTMPKQKMITRKYKMTTAVPILNTEKVNASEKNNDLKNYFSKSNKEFDLKHRTEDNNPKDSKNKYISENTTNPYKMEFIKTLKEKVPTPIKTYRFYCQSEMLDYRVYQSTSHLNQNLKKPQSENIKENNQYSKPDALKESDNKNQRISSINKSIHQEKKYMPEINSGKSDEKKQVDNKNQQFPPNIISGFHQRCHEEKHKFQEINKTKLNPDSAHNSNWLAEDNRSSSTANLEKKKGKSNLVKVEENKTDYKNNKETSDERKIENVKTYKERLQKINSQENSKKGETKEKVIRQLQSETHGINRSVKEQQIPMILYRLSTSTDQEAKDIPSKEEIDHLTLTEKQSNKSFPSTLKLEATEVIGSKEKRSSPSIKTKKEEKNIKQHDQKKNIETFKTELKGNNVNQNTQNTLTNRKISDETTGQIKDNERFIIVIHLKQEDIKETDGHKGEGYNKNKIVNNRSNHEIIKKYIEEEKKVPLKKNVKVEAESASFFEKLERNPSFIDTKNNNIQSNNKNENFQLSLKDAKMMTTSDPLHISDVVQSNPIKTECATTKNNMQTENNITLINLKHKKQVATCTESMYSPEGSSLEIKKLSSDVNVKNKEDKEINVMQNNKPLEEKKNVQKGTKENSNDLYRKETQKKEEERSQHSNALLSSNGATNTEIVRGTKNEPNLLLKAYLDLSKKNMFPSQNDLISETKTKKEVGIPLPISEQELSSKGIEEQSTNIEKNLRYLSKEITNMKSTAVKQPHKKNEHLLTSINEEVKKNDKIINTDFSIYNLVPKRSEMDYLNKTPENQANKYNSFSNQINNMDEYVSTFIDIFINKNLGDAVNTNMFLMHGFHKMSFLKVLLDIQHDTKEMPRSDKMSVVESDGKTMVKKQMALNNSERKIKQIKNKEHLENMSMYNLFDHTFVLQSFNKVSLNRELTNVFLEELDQSTLTKMSRKIDRNYNTKATLERQTNVNMTEKNKDDAFEIINQMEKCGRLLVKQSPDEVSFLEVLDYCMPIKFMKNSIKELSSDRGVQMYGFNNSKHMSNYSKYRADKGILENKKMIEDGDTNVSKINNKTKVLIDNVMFSSKRNYLEDDNKHINLRKTIKQSNSPMKHERLNFHEMHGKKINTFNNNKQPALTDVTLRTSFDYKMIENCMKEERKDCLKIEKEIKEKDHCIFVSKQKLEPIKNAISTIDNIKESQNIVKIEPEVLQYINKIHKMSMAVAAKNSFTALTSTTITQDKKCNDNIFVSEEIKENITFQKNEFELHLDEIGQKKEKQINKNDVEELTQEKKFALKEIPRTYTIKTLEKTESSIFDIIKDCKIGNFKNLTKAIQKHKFETAKPPKNKYLCSSYEHEIQFQAKPEFINYKNKNTRNELSILTSAVSDTKNNIGTSFEVYIKSESPTLKYRGIGNSSNDTLGSMTAPNKEVRNHVKENNISVSLSNSTDKESLDPKKEMKTTFLKESHINTIPEKISPINKQQIPNYVKKELEVDKNNNKSHCVINGQTGIIDKEKITSNEEKLLITNFEKHNISIENNKEPKEIIVSDAETKSLQYCSESLRKASSDDNKCNKSLVATDVKCVPKQTKLCKYNKETPKQIHGFSNEQVKNSVNSSIGISTSDLYKKTVVKKLGETEFRHSNEQKLSPVSSIPSLNKTKVNFVSHVLNDKSAISTSNKSEDKNINLDLTEKNIASDINKQLLIKKDDSTLGENKTSFQDICVAYESKKKKISTVINNEDLKKQEYKPCIKEKDNIQTINNDKNKPATINKEFNASNLIKNKLELESINHNDIKLQVVSKGDKNLHTYKDRNNNKSLKEVNNQTGKIIDENSIRVQEKSTQQRLKDNESLKLCIRQKRRGKSKDKRTNSCLSLEYIPSGSRCIKQHHNELKEKDDIVLNETSLSKNVCETNINQQGKNSMESIPVEETALESTSLTMTVREIHPSSKLNKCLLNPKQQLEDITKDKRVKSLKRTLSKNLKPKEEFSIIQRPPHSLMSLLNIESEKKRSDDYKRDTKPVMEQGFCSHDRISLATTKIQPKITRNSAVKAQRFENINNMSRSEHKDVTSNIAPEEKQIFSRDSKAKNNTFMNSNKLIPNDLGFNFIEQELSLQEKKSKQGVKNINKDFNFYPFHHSMNFERQKNYKSNPIYILKPRPKSEGFISQSLRSSSNIHMCPLPTKHAIIIRKPRTKVRQLAAQGNQSGMKPMTPSALKYKISKYRFSNMDSRVNKTEMKKNYCHSKANMRPKTASNIHLKKNMNLPLQFNGKEQHRGSVSLQSVLETPSRKVTRLTAPLRVRKIKLEQFKEKISPETMESAQTKPSQVNKIAAQDKHRHSTKGDNTILNETVNKKKPRGKGLKLNFQEMCEINKKNQTKMVSMPTANKKKHHPVLDVKEGNIHSSKSSTAIEEHIKQPSTSEIPQNQVKNISSSKRQSVINPINKSNDLINNIECCSDNKNHHKISLVNTMVNNVKEKLQNIPSSVSKMMSPSRIPKNKWLDITDIIKYTALLKGKKPTKKRQQRHIKKVNETKDKYSNTNISLSTNYNIDEKSSPHKTHQVKLKSKSKSNDTFQRRRRISDMLNFKSMESKRNCPQMSYSEVLNKFYAGSRTETVK